MKKKWITVVGLKKLVATAKIEKTKTVSKSMKNNAYFASPYPPLNELDDKANLAEQAYIASRDGGKTLTDDFHHKMDNMERALLMEANYVEVIANLQPDIGDEIIHSGGFEFKRVPTHIARTFHVQNGVIAGTVDARTKSAGARASYIWQYVPADGGDFATAGITTKAKFTFINLDRGRLYKFRVASVTPAGQSAWSDELLMYIL